MALGGEADSELASKKYGLNWDSSESRKRWFWICENNLPVLNE